MDCSYGCMKANCVPGSFIEIGNGAHMDAMHASMHMQPMTIYRAKYVRIFKIYILKNIFSLSETHD